MTWFDSWFPENDVEGITFRRFLDGGAEGFDADATPLAHILRHYKADAAVSDRPNVSLFHYADMTRDLKSTFSRLADILGITHSESVIDQLVQAATFDNMKDKAERYAPSGGKGFFKSDSEFFHSGTSGKWLGILADEELANYDAMMNRYLDPKDREWLEYGSRGKVAA